MDFRRVVLEGGNGGDGCVAFAKVFLNAKAGPCGGDGGNGGHVVLRGLSANLYFLCFSIFMIQRLMMLLPPPSLFQLSRPLAHWRVVSRKTWRPRSRKLMSRIKRSAFGVTGDESSSPCFSSCSTIFFLARFPSEHAFAVTPGRHSAICAVTATCTSELVAALGAKGTPSFSAKRCGRQTWRRLAPRAKAGAWSWS